MEGSRSKDAVGLGFGHSPTSLPQQPPALPAPPPSILPKTRLQLWFIRVRTGILVWTCLVQLLTIGQIWHRPHLSGVGGNWDSHRLFGELTGRFAQLSVDGQSPMPAAPPLRSRPANMHIHGGERKRSYLKRRDYWVFVLLHQKKHL